MKRWGTKTECPKCGVKAYHLHSRIPDIAGTARAACVRCGSALQMTADGYGSEVEVGNWLGSTRVDGDGPGSNLTVENHERTTLTDEQQTEALRILGIALPEGVDL